MALEFKKYERASSGELEDLGTVGELAGKKGLIKFIPKNFRDASKRVAVIIERKDGTSVQVSCSEQVSKGLRDKTITDEHLVGLPILENEDGVAFISLSGGALVELKVDSITPKAMKATALSYDELVGL